MSKGTKTEKHEVHLGDSSELLFEDWEEGGGEPIADKFGKLG